MDICHKCGNNFGTRNGPEDVLKCCFCEKQFHGPCVGFGTQETLFFNTSRSVTWNCDACVDKRQLLSNIANKFVELQNVVIKQSEIVQKQFEIIQKQGEDIETLKKLMDELRKGKEDSQISSEPATKRSFADIIKDKESSLSPATRISKVRKMKDNKSGVPNFNQKSIQKIIVVKSKNGKESSNEIRNQLKTLLDPCNDPVKCINTTKKDNVIIRCNNEEAVNIVTQKLSASDCAESLSIERPKERKLLVKLIGIEDEMNKEELLKRIRVQNDFVSSSDELSIINIKKGFNNNYTATVECGPDTYRKMLEKRKLFIYFSVVKVVECLNLNRCFKCQEYGHVAESCKNEPVCPKCAENHKIDNCGSSEKCCINCVRLNKDGAGRSTEHFAWSNACPVMLKRLEFIKKKFPVV